MKLAMYDLQTKLNRCVKQLFQIQNHLAVTSNQTCWQSRQTGSKPIRSSSLTYQNKTWCIDIILGTPKQVPKKRQTRSDLLSLQGLHVSKPTWLIHKSYDPILMMPK